ncbi:proliferation marker protein Ki-67 isoform X3 [Astyanax mexicanus]|uniref:proliferation marker protein Ki-67 isoform X3 n=1 Tax=Astyanax mexicanus TaxID=7994 RepID=UPI0020CADEFE|nr:proliferation marker protein Ki-67 isoform X3 [Astyanax mexicanus]
MPLHGKIVVIKRNGADGVEFPLTASCLFGRKPECDIRIQLPQVSKEHCKIELNENKELILTNLSSVNPTCINGEKLQQSERLKHGDLITIIDRSFRFEYPPPPTPKKKRLSSADKGEAVKVLQNQQVRTTPGPTDKKISEHPSDTCLKDGSNLPTPLDQSIEASKGDGNLQKKQKTDNMSPFSELYQMVKKDLASKSPWKGADPPKSPLARPQVDQQEPRKVLESSDLSNENKKPVTPQSAKKKRRSSNVKAMDHSESVSLEDSISACPMDVSSVDTEATMPVKDTPAKQKRSSAASINSTSLEGSSTPVSRKKTPQATPQKFSADEVAQQILLEQSCKTPKSPKSRRSAGSQSQSPAVTPQKQAATQPSTGPKTPIANHSQTPTRESEESEAKQSPRTSPRANAGKRFQVQDVLRDIVATPATEDNGRNKASSKKHKCDDLPLPVPKRKRVSFGNQLSPELFDKRLPPNSPLRRGATPGRRSLGFSQKPQSLLRRASTIGLMAFHLTETVPESPTKNASPKRASSPGKSPKVQTMKTSSPAKTPSPKKQPTKPKTPTPAKSSSSPKAKTPSPKTPTPAKSASSPKAKTPSPKTPTPAKSSSSPKAKTPSPKTPTPAKSSSSPKAKTPSPKTPTPAKSSSSPKAKTPSPKTPTPATSSSSPKAKTPSPKTPTPAKSSSSPKAKTPSPKRQPKTPQLSGRISSTSVKTPLRSGGSAIQTPTTQGRFSITRIATPSPEAKAESVSVEVSREYATPKISRRSSMKASARKTPKSALKSAFEVMRSRRSGASRANLKVVRSWADIVKFGQVKPQLECGAKKAVTKKMPAKDTQAAKPKTPARRLKEDTSTGHAESPATIVVGKAYVRAAQRVGAAPKVVHNIALFKKDMKMDEDLTGVADIFKTPARRKSKRGVDCNDPPETPLSGSSLTEMSVMNTPEESGEMLVSPMSVARTTDLGYYNSEAVTRLLQDNQGADLDGSQVNDPKNEVAEPQTVVETPRLEPAPSECLTGIKKLMRTPKQKAEPIHDLRGKLLKTPKEPKQTLEENYEGVKELLKTPKQKGTPVKDLAGLKRLMRTPEVTSSPVLCATGLKNLMKTPKDSTEQEDDLTGVKQLMKTPRLKGAPVENAFGVKRLMKTPKQKGKPVEEDLTGIQQMMKTPKQKSTPVEDLTGIQQMMKTPKQMSTPVVEALAVVAEQDHDLFEVKQLVKTPRLKGAPVENAFGLKRLMKTPKQKGKPVEEDLTGIQQMMKTPKQMSTPVVEALAVVAEQDHDLSEVKQLVKTPRLKGAPVENAFGLKRLMKTPKPKGKPVEEDLTGIQQMMKTPKQQSTPVEDLTGVKRLLRTPKEKREPVENGKQRGAEVVEDFTGLAELVQEPIVDAEIAESDQIESAEMDAPVTSATTEDATEESEDKENICPVESMNNKIEAAVSIQNIPLGKEATFTPGRKSGQEKAEFTSGEVALCSDVQECAPEAVVEAASCLPTLEGEEKAELTSSPKKPRGRRAKAAQDSLEKNEHAPTVEAVPPVSAPMKGRRGKVFIELHEPVSVPSPVRKSARGRTPKTQSEDKEANQAQAVETSQDVEQMPECPPPTVKPKRGRKAEQNAVEVEAVNTVADLEATKSLVEAVPVKAKRGRGAKPEVENPLVISASQEVQELSLPKDADENINVVVELAAPEPLVKPKVSAAKVKRGRRAKQELENPPIIPVSHELAAPEVTVEEKDIAMVNTVAESEATETSAIPEVSLKSPVPVVKAKRGRRAKQELENPPVVPEVAVEEKDVVAESEPSVIPEVSLMSPIPAVKAKRGRRAKQDLENPPVLAVAHELTVPETAVENESVPPESVELQTSVETDVVKTSARTRRGRTTKKETAEPSSTAVEVDVTSSDSLVVADELPQMHVVKPGRGRRAPLKAQPREDADDQPAAAETSPAVTETEEHVETVVKNVRGSKRTKQPKSSQVLEDAQEKVEDHSEVDHDADKQTEAPVNKSVRGKRTAVIRDEPEGLVKRGRRGAAASSAEVPKPVGKPTRGRRAALKTEQKVSEVATAVDEPVKEASNLPEPKSDDLATSQASSEETVCDVETSEAPAKRGRGRYAKKGKVVAKGTSVKADDTSATEEADVENKKKASRKAVSWNSDLVASKNIETVEPPAAEDVPQQKSSRKKAEPAAKASTDDVPVSDTKQSAEPPAKGRKGRMVKKPEEQPAEKSEPAPVENVPAVRRGRAGASLDSKQDEVAAVLKRGSKRKELDVSDEATTLESLSKRRKGQADGAEAQKEVAVVGRGRRAAAKEAIEETPEVEKEQSESASKNSDNKPVRGKRKAAQEVDSISATSEEPVSETSSRRGARVQKKTEIEVSSAPVRRTRRK